MVRINSVYNTKVHVSRGHVRTSLRPGRRTTDIVSVCFYLKKFIKTFYISFLQEEQSCAFTGVRTDTHTHPGHEVFVF